VTGPPESCEPADLARHYGPLVYRTAYRLLGDAAQAEDVQQEVFLRLLESRREGVASWPGYLVAASTRIAIDVLRRRQRWWGWLPRWQAHAPAVAASAEEAGIEAQRAARLRQALCTLTRREAQCFALRYLDGLDVSEVAVALQLKENNVGVILHRARRRLEARLSETAEEARS
jgi:RNA polymerase sigma factor (sigma-70 family)